MSDTANKDRRRFFRIASALAAFAGGMGIMQKASAVEPCTHIYGNPCEEGQEGCMFHNGYCELYVPPTMQYYHIIELYPGFGTCCDGPQSGDPICRTAVPPSSSPCGD